MNADVESTDEQQRDVAHTRTDWYATNAQATCSAHPHEVGLQLEHATPTPKTSPPAGTRMLITILIILAIIALILYIVGR
jgi:hypothetical protein